MSSMELHKVLFLVHYFFYINDVPKITTKSPKCTPYAGDTGIVVTNSICKHFKINMNRVFLDIHEWFKASLLSLNCKSLITYKLVQKNYEIDFKHLVSWSNCWRNVMEKSHWAIHVQLECCLFNSQNCKSCHVTRNSKDYLFFRAFSLLWLKA